MIQRGEPALTGGIRDCWKRCFENEDPNYIDFFFRCIYKPEYGYADVEDSRVVAALCRVPHAIMFNERVIKASMLVGAATLPEYRGQGIGKTLLKTLAKTAVAEGCGRVEWSCLDWNAPSIEFYRAQGALPMDEWTIYRLTGEALTAFAADD